MKIDINSEPRIKAGDVLRFIESCNRQRIAIIGIEGGILSDGKFIPDLDLVADLSRRGNLVWSEFWKKCNHSAALFLNETDFSNDSVFVMTIIDELDFNDLYKISHWGNETHTN